MNAPAAALLLKIDTLGDLVVFAPALRALRSAWPQTRLAVVIRRAYLDLAPLLADNIEWLPTTLDPFAQDPEADPAEVQRLRAAVTALAPEIVAAATSRRNWLEAAIASAAPAARRVALGSAADDEHFATRLRVALGLNAAHVFPETVTAPANEPDWLANFSLADVLLGRPVERAAPTLAAPVSTGLPAQLGLVPGRYVVCAAAGFANVQLKTWPAARFAAVLDHLRAKHGLPAVLIGHESERAHLETVAAASVGRVSDPPSSTPRVQGQVKDLPYPALWLGRDGDLPRLAELIAGAALFLGNDTGAMHLAAALDVPVVAVFGGGTWPRFVPAARRGVALVHPLPCFGCGWDCAFGDAPCLGEITVDHAIAAVDHALAHDSFDVMEVQRLSAETQALMAKTATRHRAAAAGHLARQHKLEELTALAREKDAEIASLKAVCDEREKTIFILDGHVRFFQTENATLQAERAVHERTLAGFPADAAKAAQTIADLVVHNRNIESLLKHREAEIAELKNSAANRAAGLHDLENAKHYGRLLAEHELALQFHRERLAERDATIARLGDEETGPLHKGWLAVRSFWSAKIAEPFGAWLFRRVVENYWMQIGVLRHYAPRPLQWDEKLRATGSSLAEARALPIAIVTPSYGQEKFIERTLRSVLDQNYPQLAYVVQDGDSKDGSPAIIARHAASLRHWESVPDKGQADAIHRGFAHIESTLPPDTIMAWLNSDDLLAPGALHFVGEYFAAHPEVDVLYGHRIIIDDDDREVGRWIMPRHRPATLEWIDYVPQETLFWRKRAWDRVGGIDPTFQFALDWDLLARFHQAGCRMVRVPYFLGAFRVHAEQKTSQAIHTTGAEEMRRIRTRFHGERQDDALTIHRHARHARFWGAITARLHAVGIRW
ncbi:MAG: glycosyltransferase family 9 protein [Opitutaceae bacterium]|nr:glycosyltransferase family 9 protein [Opitutaceae bacterium]